MNTWPPCYNKNHVYHDLLVNILFNYFMNQGVNVYVEIPLSVPPIRRSRLHISEKGELIEESKVKHTSRIDLITESSNGFIRGYEVKTDFNSVVNAISYNQLLSYVSSGYFDEVYLVIPENICNRVIGSYGRYLDSNGIGLLCTSTAPLRISAVINPRRLSKNKILNLHFNEAWIKHMVMVYLRNQGYCVYPEIDIPKPLSSLPEITPLQSNPQRYLNRIDLIAIKGKCSPCDIACGACEGDVIGIEVKYGKSRLGLNELQKLRDYMRSGVVSKVYLALDNRSNVNYVLGQVKGLADVLVVDPLSRSIVFRQGNVIPCKPRFCAFVFENPSGNKLHIYSYCDLSRHRYDAPIPYSPGNWNMAISYVVYAVSKLCQGNSICLQSGEKIIYVRRTRSSHVLQVI